jgi:hypothetical protein
MRALLVLAVLVAPTVCAAGSYPVGLGPGTTSDWNGDPTCPGPGNPPLLPRVLEIGYGFGVAYLDYRGDLGNSLWLYAESNGVYADPEYGNLQRGGSSEIIPDDSEICPGESPPGPDTLIF